MKIPSPAIRIFSLIVLSASLGLAQCPQTLLVQLTGVKDSICAPTTLTVSFMVLNGPKIGTQTSKLMTGLGGTLTTQYELPGGGVSIVANYTVPGVYVAAAQVQISNLTVTCMGSTSYTIHVLDQNSTFCNPVGINEIRDDTKLILYPNPSTGAFRLQSSHETMGRELILTDVLGMEIYRWPLADNDVYELPSTLVAGTYQVKIRSKGRENSAKLIVIR